MQTDGERGGTFRRSMRIKTNRKMEESFSVQGIVGNKLFAASLPLIILQFTL